MIKLSLRRAIRNYIIGQLNDIGVTTTAPGWSPTDIPQAEADALVSLWAATNGSSWTNKWDFDIATTAEELYGVTVVGGIVSTIILGSNNLTTSNSNIDISALALIEAGVDAVLSSLVSSAGTNGTLDISGSAEPSATGVGHITTLLSRGWIITVSSADVTVISGSVDIATANGETMFFHDSITFSNVIHAGDLVTFTDSAGKVATAYALSAGSGEAYGDELTLNGGMETGNPPDNWIRNTNVTFVTDTVNPQAGLVSGKLTSTGATSRTVSQVITTDIGSLYKYAIYTRSASGDTILLQPRDGSSSFRTIGVASTEWTCSYGYRTLINNTFSHYAYVNSISGSGYIDSASLRKLTNVPTSGLLLTSTVGGVRNMKSVDLEFNPNTIIKVSIGGA